LDGATGRAGDAVKNFPKAANEIMRTTKPILACDVGGTRIKLGVVRGARLRAQIEIDAEPEKGFAVALRRIAKQIPALCRTAGVEPKSLGGFGLSFPGVIEPRTEKILSTPAGKFDDANQLDVPKLVEKFLGLPARVCNDANAALLGEWRFGAARGCRSAVLMTLGTGIGASAIIDGVPLRGQHGQAGCLGGHLTANLDGQICPCGNLGCAESEASTWALPAQARAHPNFSASRLAREKVLDYAAVFRAASRGDKLAMELRDRSIRVWSVALVNLIHAYDPEIAVIGGGIMRSGKMIMPPMRRYVSRHAWTAWGKVKIKPAALGNNAGLLGVASLFQEER
jgi:glucokinase